MTDGSGLTTRIGEVARRELALHGVVSYDDLAPRSRAELLAVHGVGPKAIRILEEELAARGQSFAS